MNSVILQSKIKPPQLRRIILRPRLLEHLERSQSYPLLIISASTGFGKTSLLTNFAHNTRTPLAWYSLDESDRDPAEFCLYLLNAVRRVYPEFGKPFEELLLQNVTELHQEVIIHSLAQQFISDLELIAPAQTALPASEMEQTKNLLIVLDDFQLAESFGVSRFVQRLVWRLPSDIQIIIATRSMPDNLLLTQLTVKQLVTTLDSQDLAFSEDEVAKLLREFYNVDNLDLSQALTAYSEGWITAVILALSNQKLLANSVAQNLKANNTAELDMQQLFGYLAQEVFQTQSAEFQNFLLKTSVLTRLTAGVCDAVIHFEGGPEPAPAALNYNNQPEVTENFDKQALALTQSVQSEKILSYLESKNLFIHHLSSDNGQEYYQYYSLFRKFLVTKLKEDKLLYRQTQIKAAEYFKAQGNLTEAIQHFIEAGELEAGAELLNEVAHALYYTGRTLLITTLLETIPPAQQSVLPHLLNIKGRIRLLKGEHSEALQLFAQAEELYRPKGLIDYAARVVMFQAQILVRIGRRKEAFSICNLVFRDYSILMKTLEGQRAIATAKLVAGSISIEEGNSNEAEKNLKEAIEIYAAINDEAQLALIDNIFGHLYHREWRVTKSNIYLERALAYYIKTGNAIREAYCRSSLAINCYIQTRFQPAEEQLNEALALAEEINDQYLQTFVLVYLGNVYRETDRHSKADLIYTQALSLARQSQIRKMELALLFEQTTNYILQEKFEQAATLVQLSQELTEDYKLPERLGYALRNQAWLELSKRSYKRALASIQKADNEFITHKASLEEARCKLAQAVILLAMGEPRKALVLLAKSLELVENFGFVPFLPFELKWASPLLEYAARKKVSDTVTEFLQKLGYSSISNLEVSLMSVVDPSAYGATVAPEPEKIASGLRKIPSISSESTGEVEDEIDYEDRLPISIKTLQEQRQNKLYSGVGKLKSDKSNEEVEPASHMAGKLTGLRVYGLEGGRVWKNGLEIKQWGNSKARELFFFLLENKASSRDQIIEAIWPDDDLRNAPQALHNITYNLRKIITPEAELKIESGRYWLNGEIWYDGYEFGNTVKTVLGQRDLQVSEADRLGRALSLYKRDYLDQFYSNWSMEIQQQMLKLYRRGLERLAFFYEERYDYHSALPLWQQIIIKDIYDEDAYRGTIECLLKMGNKPEALRQYNQCLKALEELDLKPSAQTASLFQKLA